MTSRSDLYKQLNSGNVVFPHTIGRVQYVVRNMILLAIMLPPKLIAEKSDNLFLLLVCLALFIAIAVASFWIQIIPRMRDLGWNTRLSWLMLIPGVNVIMGIGLFALPGK